MSEQQTKEQCGGSAPPETDTQLVERLMRFYSVDSLTQLILAQNRHVEKLQSSSGHALGDVARRFQREG